jgi:hypothetical protein
MAVYGPVRHHKNIIWTSEASVHIIIFWWRTGPYTAIWPSVPWTICYIVLINGCFHNGPVICPRLAIMTQARLYWPEGQYNLPRAIMNNFLKIKSFWNFLKILKSYENFELCLKFLKYWNFLKILNFKFFFFYWF